MELWSTLSVLAITTRDLSKNPSKALRDAVAQPLMVMRHHRPVACLVSIEQWAQLVGKLKDIEMNAGIDRIEAPALCDEDEAHAQGSHQIQTELFDATAVE